jgi:putative glutamine amidotransferase
VNSLHHQAVAEPGRGVRVSARSPDGVIEAIECDGMFAVGVQWHPEKLPGAGRLVLFRALVAAAGAR